MNNIKEIVKTKLGKLLLFLWLLFLLVLIGLLLLGSFQNEFLGNLAFSILPCSVLLNISVVIAHKVKCGSERLAQIVWIGFGLLVLGFLFLLVYLSGGKSGKDVGIVLFYGMFIYTFPVSIIVSLFFAGIAYILDEIYPMMNYSNNYLAVFFLWAIFFSAGYLQWFKLLPFLIEKWQARKERKEEKGSIIENKSKK